MILVTGALGRIGNATARALHHRGAAVKALVPSRSHVPALAELGIPLAEGDYDDARRLGAALLGLAERYWSARIGEGLIFDLRTELFDHVQRLPMAFFTRTQTGALVSRLNNDVVGAQNAVTSTLGSVVSNVIVLITTLSAMAFLEWRLTLLALVGVAVFDHPDRSQRGRTITHAHYFDLKTRQLPAVTAAVQSIRTED